MELKVTGVRLVKVIKADSPMLGQKIWQIDVDGPVKSIVRTTKQFQTEMSNLRLKTDGEAGEAIGVTALVGATISGDVEHHEAGVSYERFDGTYRESQTEGYHVNGFLTWKLTAASEVLVNEFDAVVSSKKQRFLSSVTPAPVIAAVTNPEPIGAA